MPPRTQSKGWGRLVAGTGHGAGWRCEDTTQTQIAWAAYIASSASPLPDFQAPRKRALSENRLAHSAKAACRGP